MNILYVSEMAANSDTGMYWSVPNQVMSQAKYDNVLWVNLRKCTCDYWEKTGVYIVAPNGAKTKLGELPSPFSKPDLVIFEGFYQDTRQMYKDVHKANIPYIIVPRGSLTKEAQKKHRLKKIIGNIYFFRKFAKNALAIHYLTEDECRNSGTKWNRTGFVMPNGVVYISDKQWQSKSFNRKRSLKGVFMGRISVFHKGLDLLTEAISQTQETLRENNITIDIYGPDRERQRQSLKDMIVKAGVEDLLIVHDHPVFGEEKEKAMLDGDFFVLTSRLEGHPMGLIEALSYGMPSLVTTGSNMSNEINQYHCGWSSSTCVDGIKESLLALASVSDRELSEMSRDAIFLAKEYQWDNIATRTHKIYTELLDLE